MVLTTREVVRMIRAEHIVPETLEEEEFDIPLGISSGAAVIFGATGGGNGSSFKNSLLFGNQ